MKPSSSVRYLSNINLRKTILFQIFSRFLYFFCSTSYTILRNIFILKDLIISDYGSITTYQTSLHCEFTIWLPKQCFWSEHFTVVYGYLVSKKYSRISRSCHELTYRVSVHFIGLLRTPFFLNFVRNASKKSGGSTKSQGKRQKAKHLGAKRGEGRVTGV